MKKHRQKCRHRPPNRLPRPLTRSRNYEVFQLHEAKLQKAILQVTKNMQILEQYYKILDSDARYNFLLSGAGTGKSVFICQKIIIDLLNKPSCHWAVFRKRSIDANRSIFPQMVNEIYRNKLHKYFRINQSTKTIFSKLNNSKAQFTGLYDANKLKSIAEVTNAVLEEADEFSEEDFLIIDSRVRSQMSVPNNIWFLFNPPEKEHWIPQRWFDGGEILPDLNEPFFFMDGEIKCCALRTHYNDNRFIDAQTKAVFESYKNHHNKTFYESLCLGIWTTRSKGAYFQSEYEKYSHTVLGKNIIFCDPAYSLVEGQGDYTCIIKSSLIGNEIHLNDVILRKNMTTKEILDNTQMLIDSNTQSVNFGLNYYEPAFWRNATLQYNIRFPITEIPSKADKLIPEALHAWTNGRVIFPANFSETKTGREAKKQLFAFEGKQKSTINKIHDDFPDALIHSIHLWNSKGNLTDFYKHWAR